ncbi:nuclear pore complex protein GP210 isoform X3 [Aristolochia californica]|uniref:nuclear pore complex protein GP210 isoform X3 n=1 Tax=Aristolochia californica TaxID=171875 RepID=UPI0035D781ED
MGFRVVFSRLLLLLVIFPSLSHSASGPHIADLTVLLPPRMTNPVEYRLQGSDGCFSWSWDHHDVLFVQPEYNGTDHCSTSARLISVAPYSGRKETAVYAADVRTGTVIRCEVFIGKISKIRIFHHSVKLDLDGLATLQVLAFDEEDNVFSSLVGLKFKWELTPKLSEVNGPLHHLVHVPLRDTPLSDCGGFCGDLNTQIKLEDTGIGSDLYVVRGTEIGQEIVSVYLFEPQFEHVGDQIILTVAEAMSLDPPSPIFVIIGALLQYSLRVIRQNTPQVIALPSPYHQWYATNSSVAEVDLTRGLADALSLGITSVIVEDTRVAGHVQTSMLHVVLPEKLHLYLVPVTNSAEPMDGIIATSSTDMWYIVAGLQYVVHMKAFSAGPDAYEIYITKNNDVRLLFNHPALWDTAMVPEEACVKHGWRNSRLIKPTSEGLGSLTAKLSYKKGNTEKLEVLKVVQQIIVCNPVEISKGNEKSFPWIIRLPWAPKIYQEVGLTARGGCAKTFRDYNWYSSDTATVSVSSAGVVRANRPGKATVKVVSVFDSMNYDEVVIEVSVPASMIMLQEFPVEAVVGSHLRAAVTMKTAHGHYFFRCDAFSSLIRWQVLAGSESFRIVNTTGEPSEYDALTKVVHLTSFMPPCAWTHLYALNTGRATLHASLTKELQTSDPSFGGPIILKATCLIAAYPPLVAKQAGHGNEFGGYWIDLEMAQTLIDKLYLVPGTELDIVLLGGPEPWDHGVEFFESVDAFTEDDKPLKDGPLINQASTGNLRLFRISCHTIRNYKLVFSRGNLVGDGHPQPAVANLEVFLICSIPSLITLIVNEPVNKPDFIRSAIQADRGPGKIRVSPISVANSCTIRVAAVGVHDSGSAFANSSSLCLQWELSGCEQLAYWKESDHRERSECNWERFLVLQNATGLCVVQATVRGLSGATPIHLLDEVSFLLESSKKDLTDGVRLQLVSSLRIIPQSILLFFDPHAKAKLSIIGGTCFLEAMVNDSNVVEIIQPPASTHCSSLRLSPKGLGTALITVHDVGLTPAIAASSMVQVADVDWFKIVSQEEISLMEGTIQQFDVLAGIRDGSIFDPSQYVNMHIHVHIEDGVLDLVDKDGFSRPVCEEIQGPTFFIRAAQLGVTTLHVSARRQSGHELLSQLVKVEVYAPLQLLPEDIFLSPGASYVLTVRGGPMIGAVVEYVSMDDEIAKVHRSSGRLSAVSEGNTSIHATAYGHEGAMICQAYGRVEVGIPSKMVLNLQSEKLGVGHDMKLFISSAEGNLFSFYELCKNYEWKIDNDQVLSFQTLGPSNYNDLGFMNVVFGRSAGKSHIHVSFSCDFVSSGSFRHSVSYNASGSLLVVSEPPLALGVPITWVLPPFYTSSDLLPAPIESYNEWDARNRKGAISYSLLRTCGGKTDFRQQDSISIVGGRIKTKESDNLACIQAKDLTTGNTAIASCVRVAEVSQVQVTTKDFPFHVAEVAPGAEVELLVSLRDALGYSFHEAYGVVPLHIDTNYPDIVSIELPKAANRTQPGVGKIFLQANHHGRSLIRISMNDDPQKADYILISVGAHLHPQNPVLNVGHHLNFNVTGRGKSDVGGRWFSANESVVSVDMLSGEAHAVGEGSSEVFLEGSTLNLRTKVMVLRVASVLVDAPGETLTNVPFPLKGYNFSVRFSDKFGAYGSTGEFMYDCRVDPSFVGYAKPWRDLDTGNKYCLFFPYSPEHLVHSIPKLKAGKTELTSHFGEGVLDISVIATLREDQEVMGSAHALFIGGFSLLGKSKLNLKANSNKCLITVVGNTDVVFYWTARDRILVNLLHKDESGIGGHAEYEVKVLYGQSVKDRLVIVLPATGQNAEIDINYEAEDGDVQKMNRGIIWTAMLWILFSFLVAVIFMRYFWGTPYTSRRSVPATPTVSAAPVTPERHPSSGDQTSPRTPQPYIEYIRRTIDETPYYRRTGRRFDPQNTY